MVIKLVDIDSQTQQIIFCKNIEFSHKYDTFAAIIRQNLYENDVQRKVTLKVKEASLL
jgi:hypothetical protein